MPDIPGLEELLESIRLLESITKKQNTKPQLIQNCDTICEDVCKPERKILENPLYNAKNWSASVTKELEKLVESANGSLDNIQETE